MSLEESKELIQSLYSKYENHPYMFQRLKYHLQNILPTSLETEFKNYEKRIERQILLSNEQKIFIQVFLSKNRYYYLSSNNCYYFYNGKNYTSAKEDEIQCKLLIEISKDKTLSQWKYKTNLNILKQIKERHLFKSIPDSETIQHVIKTLSPMLFETKHHVKYFLTILGDNILKKNPDLIFLINPKTRKILSEIENISYITTGLTNITQNFMTKYHENYQYQKCRLLNMNVDNVSIDVWKDILKKIGLDILCVAAHYSTRFGDSDTLLVKHCGEELKKYVLYLKLNTQEEIVNQFCSYSIEKVDTPSLNDPKTVFSKFSMNWKNMHFIWKHYISQFSFPNMIYSNQLKTLLKERFLYDEESETFLNCTSKYLPSVGDFIQFWEKTMMTTSFEFEDFDYEMENDEICSLFKTWVQQNPETCLSKGAIIESDVVMILTHFYPNVEIIENKYIMNMSCSFWDKVQDIQESLDEFKKNNKPDESTEFVISLISFDKVYDFYCDYANTTDKKWIVSKRFFEKYLLYSLYNFVEYDSFLSTTWLIEG